MSTDAGAFCVGNPGLQLSSGDSIKILAVNLLGRLAALEPFQHISAEWLAVWLVWVCF